MTDVSNPASPIDQAWQTRIPPGWIRFPNGSVGPPNQPSPIDQAWPTRVPQGGGMGYPSQGILPTNQPGTPPGVGPVGYRGPPLSGASAGPGMGYPGAGTTINTTGPDIIPPGQRPINPTQQVGPFTGGTSTDASWSDWADPRNWFKGGQTFNAGQPMTRGQMNPFGFIGRGNPYWRGAIAAGGALQPTPAETGELPLSLSGARPQHPPSTGRMPPPIQYGMPFPQNTDVAPQRGMPWPDTGVAPPAAATPPAVAGGGPARGRINPASVNVGYGTPGIPGNATAQAAPGPSPWTMIDRPNASAAGRNPGATQMGALDLSGLFNRSAPAAAVKNANPANIPAANSQPVSAAAPAPTMSQVNPNWGPLQRGAVWPNQMGPRTANDYRNWAALHSGFGG